MKKLFIEGTAKTPTVNFDPKTGKFSMQGRSLPENVTIFFTPLESFLEEYKINSAEETVLDICLQYFNSASSKKILTILKLLPNGSIIEWHYDEDDEDMLQAGQEYEETITEDLDLNLNLTFIYTSHKLEEQ